MKNTKASMIHILIGVLYLLGMIFISYGIRTPLVLFIAVIFLVLAIARKDVRYLILSLFTFLLSFYLYTLLRNLFHQNIDDLALTVLLDRLLLSLIIISLVITAYLCRKHISLNLRKPKWNNLIYFPFITHGFHSTKISLFLKLSILGNVAVFIPLIYIFGDWGRMKDLLFFALLFSIVNAFLEELIWRGTLFQVLSKEVSIFYATIITSLAFGLHHIAIGIPFAAAISFSIGGVFFAIVTTRSESTIPAILWHFIINLFMVFSGFIIP
ncbi:CPBP family intramembrane glutamic endopeptidase [Neobacillus sp. FSL H8-0543]|uniref:CPBP family intramembrane glutamic endopeptidase n=1 Tax=Neobacillus sp. FSL H8-0543 TaxID=2954672 RepID=UPI0031591491